MQTLFRKILGMLYDLQKLYIFYSRNSKPVFYNINYLIHAFHVPKFVIFYLYVYEIKPIRKFFREDTGFCRCCGRLIS